MSSLLLKNKPVVGAYLGSPPVTSTRRQDADDAEQASNSPERWRPPYLRSMLHLHIGQWAELVPEPGDSLEALWERVRRQATRYRTAGRYFHLHKKLDHILVQRVDKEHRGKLAPFLRLAVGQKVLCTEPFTTEREKTNLRRRLLYLSTRGHHIWLERHSDGLLYYRCIGRWKISEPIWGEAPVDDGSDFQGAQVVCCPFDLRSSRIEFGRIRRMILASRATATATAAAAAADLAA